MIRFIVFCFAVLTLIGTVFSAKINFELCQEDIKNCNISDVRLSPCKNKNVTPDQPCKLDKKSVGLLEVDFTPQFIANNLTAYLYWTGVIDVALPDMDHEACKTTTCPTVSDQPQTYSYSLFISSLYPSGTYKVKTLIYGEDKENQSCCMIFKMKIK